MNNIVYFNRGAKIQNFNVLMCQCINVFIITMLIAFLNLSLGFL